MCITIKPWNENSVKLARVYEYSDTVSYSQCSLSRVDACLVTLCRLSKLADNDSNDQYHQHGDDRDRNYLVGGHSVNRSVR